MSIKQRAIAAMAGMALAAGVAGAMPAAAEAAWQHDGWSWVSSNTGQAYARDCPNTGCRALVTLRNNYPVGMICWVDSQVATGNYTSARWFRVWWQGNPRYSQGYIHSSLVARQVPTPRC